MSPTFLNFVWALKFNLVGMICLAESEGEYDLYHLMNFKISPSTYQKKNYVSHPDLRQFRCEILNPNKDFLTKVIEVEESK